MSEHVTIKKEAMSSGDQFAPFVPEVARKRNRHGSPHGVAGKEAGPGAGHGSTRSADGMMKIASTLGGGVSAGLAAAMIVPGAPVIASAAAIVGLVGSGLLLRKYT